MQRAPSSCSTPRGVAANCATLRVAKARPILWARQQFAASEDATELARVAVRRVGWRRTARLYEPQKLSQQFNPKQSPPHSPMLGLARRENRIRFSRPKNKHSPKLVPVLRPVSASLRLRCRSATAVARGNSCRIGRMPTGRICPLKRAGDGVFAQNRVFRAPWEILSKHASAF